MSSWTRNQRRESGDDVHGRTNVAGAGCARATEVLGFEQHVSGAVSERALQLKHHQPVTIKAQALLGDRTSGPIVYFFGRHTRSSLARSCASQATAQLSENPSRPAVNALVILSATYGHQIKRQAFVRMPLD